MKISNLKTMHKSELVGIIMLTRESLSKAQSAVMVEMYQERLHKLTEELERRANQIKR